VTGCAVGVRSARRQHAPAARQAVFRSYVLCRNLGEMGHSWLRPTAIGAGASKFLPSADSSFALRARPRKICSIWWITQPIPAATHVFRTSARASRPNPPNRRAYCVDLGPLVGAKASSPGGAGLCSGPRRLDAPRFCRTCMNALKVLPAFVARMRSAEQTLKQSRSCCDYGMRELHSSGSVCIDRANCVYRA